MSLHHALLIFVPICTFIIGYVVGYSKKRESPRLQAWDESANLISDFQYIF